MRRVFAALLVLLPLGCNGKEPVKTHPVSGRVLYDGKPAAGVKVFFLPTSAPTVPVIPSNPRGVTDASGRFQLTTFTDGDGAAEGGYQVILLWPPEGSESEEADGDRLLGWYDAVNSKLTARVKAGENRLSAFNLPRRTKPPQAGEGVPGRN
jgi:hypothetical protein